MAVSFLKRSFLIIVTFNFIGCTGVFNSLNKKEKLILYANCSEKAPVNLSYYCKPSVDYTPGPNSLSTYSLTPEFQLINNTCTGLSINSTTGVISGVKAMLELSSTCSYQIQVSQGSKTEASETITITGSNAITYSFSEKAIAVQKGGNTKQVSVEFSESLPFKADVEYEIFSQEDTSLPFLEYSTKGKISAVKGANKIDLSFSIPSSSSFSNTAYYGFSVKNLKPDIDNVFLDLRAYESSKAFDKISAGNSHTCAIASGELYCWGTDNDGQIGNGSGSTNDVLSAQKIGSSSTWNAIASGSYHTCGIDNGELFCWGRDNYGQVGNGSGSSSNVETPQKIGSSNTWSAIALGSYHTCGIDNGELFCWGVDFRGQIGNGSGSTSAIEAPQKIGSSSSWSVIAAGDTHTCGIDNGELYCWGYDSNGQIGNGSGTTSDVEAPQKIGSSSSWSVIAAGRHHTCGIDNGELFCWGADSNGQIGNGSGSTSDVEAPQKIGNSNTWNAISLGTYHTCGIDNGVLYCWGGDNFGQLGNGYSSTGIVETPTTLEASSNWAIIAAGSTHTCGIKNNELYCWGRNNDGQLGNSSKAISSIDAPKIVGDSNTWNIISTGDSYTCGIDNGELYCWGSNGFGKLGIGSSFSGNIPVPQKINESNTWTAISAGNSHTCGIDNGELYCWGRDSNGQVGNGSGSTDDVLSPQKIGSSNTWSMISTGNGHTCGIDNGELYCWGVDFAGQLGNGSGLTSDMEAPQKIGSSNTWSMISTKEFHTCGIDNGELYCWGEDYAGQIGNGSGTTSDVEAPQKIGSSNTWTAISAGNSHTCGIDNGELYCWGQDFNGQIGNGSGSTSNIETPQKVGSSNTWSMISTGGGHSCGIDNGELFCWGEDYYSQIGNGSGSTSDVEAPQKIGNSGSWNAITLGSYHTCGINSEKLFCWGENNNAQSGFKPNINIPTLVVE